MNYLQKDRQKKDIKGLPFVFFSLSLCIFVFGCFVACSGLYYNSLPIVYDLFNLISDNLLLGFVAIFCYFFILVFSKFSLIRTFSFIVCNFFISLIGFSFYFVIVNNGNILKNGLMSVIYIISLSLHCYCCFFNKNIFRSRFTFFCLFSFIISVIINIMLF